MAHGTRLTTSKVLATTIPIRHHYLLDLLRFLAAMAVVVWHYQHFFFVAPGALESSFSVQNSPFFRILKPAYLFGGHAVEFFFVLSGFIFFWLYRSRIADGSTTARQFFVYRFSRLYPLHFVSLLFVAVGQALAFSTLGEFIVYPENDTKHFILNLLFASHWGFEDGWSFNAPVWSVSVEILLYSSFFLIALLRRPLFLAVLLGLVLGTCVALLYKAGIGWAIVCFFMGGLAQGLYAHLEKQNLPVVVVYALMALCALVGIILGYLSLLVATEHLKFIFYFGAYPLVTLCFALLQLSQPRFGLRVARLGDLSYAIYLLHFPLQLCIILVDRAFVVGIDYTSSTFFFGFFSTLLILSYAVYKGFERPMQRKLRRALLPD